MNDECYEALKSIFAQIHAEKWVEKRFDQKYLKIVENWIDETAKEHETMNYFHSRAEKANDINPETGNTAFPVPEVDDHN